MATGTQICVDLLVLGMTDEAVLQSIEYHLEKHNEGLAEHNQVAAALMASLDNVYGDGSYDNYITNGILPSQQ